ncbi:hypothetical protein [Olleya sp. Hel_I_94]|uniref:hypothetical protein n=1 Tax=Olleya sp. Hel_I_94 TaxID=1250001 RepID=UPI0011A8C79D|nr:hypothetical protein [Olleya sp. Hel_I_94]TVZ49870.1 hypothetical protein JM82_0309 [Olleya sp. Hel_I_94]
MAEKKQIDNIQKLRKELTELINEKIKPIRNELDENLNNVAKKICPFKINDIITLDNGKKGKITEIKYFSLDYPFYKSEDEQETYDFFNTNNDEIDYGYAYKVDDKEFSITWEINGFRMRKNDTEVGKVRFVGISPVNYRIDVENKIITEKPLSDFVNPEYLFDVDDLK